MREVVGATMQIKTTSLTVGVRRGGVTFLARAALIEVCGRSDCQAGGAHDLDQFGCVSFGKSMGLVAVEVEDTPARAALVEERDDDFGEVARVAGDVVFAEFADIVDDDGLAGSPRLAAGSVEPDGAARGRIAAMAEDHLGLVIINHIKPSPGHAGGGEVFPQQIDHHARAIIARARDVGR